MAKASMMYENATYLGVELLLMVGPRKYPVSMGVTHVAPLKVLLMIEKNS